MFQPCPYATINNLKAPSFIFSNQQTLQLAVSTIPLPHFLHLLSSPSMAPAKYFLACLVFTLLALNLMDDAFGFQSHSLATTAGERNLLQQIDCGASCSARCRLSSRPRLCKRACGTCCARCNCVPSGTAGNLDECPCYANMTTHGNKRKCP